MRKIVALFMLVTVVGRMYAQVPADSLLTDTARAAQIIDRYMEMVDFSMEKTDSVLCVVTKVVDLDKPTDTMTIYRWYMAPRNMRVEFWQNGRIEDGYYSDGIKYFRNFHTQRREWAAITRESFYDITFPLDIRGALYDWRTKGSEAYYLGDYKYEGHPVERLYVTSPGAFDRYYYFEKETGLLFLVTELDHMFGDSEKALNAQRVDIRAWHEFTPVHYFYMPSIESYRFEQQRVVMYHSYHYEAHNVKLFTEDYHRL